MRLVIAVAIALVCMPNGARAWTGYELLQLCENGENQSSPVRYQDAAYCSGFVYGILNGADTALDIRGGERFFCFPEPPPQVGQLTLIYREWAHRNPQYLSHDAGAAVLAALTAAFPCKP